MMSGIYNKIGVVDSYFPHEREGAVLTWVNDQGKPEKVTFFTLQLTIDGVPADPPIRSRVSIGERVSFDAEPNNQRNSWGVTWKATCVRKLTTRSHDDPKRGVIVYVEPTAAVISFTSGSGEELCAFTLTQEAQVNGVSIAKGLDDFLPRLTEVDFVPVKINPLIIGRKFNCKWQTYSLFAESVEVPETHEVPRVAEIAVRATVLQVSERRATLSFVRPDTNQSSKALLITPNFHPPTFNLMNVIKYRDELEMSYVPHKYPQNADGCPFFATKARHLTREEKAKLIARSSSAPSVPLTNTNSDHFTPSVQPLMVGPRDVTSFFTTLLNAPPGAQTAAAPATSAQAKIPSFPPPSISNMLVVRLLKQAKLQTIWDQGELFKTWLTEHPEYSCMFEQLITEKYAAGDKAEAVGPGGDGTGARAGAEEESEESSEEEDSGEETDDETD